MELFSEVLVNSMKMLSIIFFLVIMTLFSMPAETSPTAVIPVYTYKVINSFPHDRKAFTQGLIFADGFLYESTGLYGHSSLRKVDLKTGKVLQERSLPSQFFGEGITIFNNTIIQLTWQSRVGFVYDKKSFELLKTFSYPTEGWGITHDEKRLIMSDGSSTIYFFDPEALKEIGRIEVFDHDERVTGLNELEFIQGEIFANVWPTERIVRISPHSGRVTGWIDLSGILSLERAVDVLNGIAYDEKNNRLLVTGKLWPNLFELKLIPRESKMP